MIRASSLLQAKMCPGSVRAQDGLAEQPSNLAASGTRVHAAFAGDADEMASLSWDEVKTLDKACFKYDRFFEEYGLGEELAEEVFEVEMRMYGISGHPDRIALLKSGRALLSDLKTGWKEQDEPATNYQLRAYAFLAFYQFPEIKEIVATIIPSNFAPPTPTIYQRVDLPAIQHELLLIVQRAAAEDAPRVTGDHCRYCKAYGTSKCPETSAQIEAVAVAPLDIARLTDSEACVSLAMLNLVAIRAEEGVKAMTAHKEANPDAWPSLALVPGASKRHVPNAELAYGHLSDLVNASEFASVCKVGVGDLEELIEGKIRASKQLKGKALAAEVRQLLEPIVSTKQDRAKLVPVKKEIE